ncbi:hypothetical protein PAESOLCIP111_06460 [Paenibacillus solanacearum]|uniref:Uncharacterized protein n=1 Tax=Paenibacillus solanacearum TaxID=2048548 RepID=A0A916K8C0_9BACL|nr:hypothetical protein [Paenibacillus solanacearum]CAG7652115.1 hypothetical protein PAESOLCIP111_06460 [Paenibacillus solanacearum]
MAVQHAYEQGYKREDSQYRNGLAGYDAWIEAFQKRNVEVFGNTLHGLYVHDQRMYAAEFMERIAIELQGEDEENQQLSSLAGQAARHYDKVSGCFGAFRNRFPFPKGGDPNDPEQAEAAIQLLTEARAEEGKGVGCLEKMLQILNNQAR